MTKQDQTIFFSILRAAIWERPIDADIPDGYDWSTLIRAYEDHSLLGVVAHAIMLLPESKLPSDAQRTHIYDHVAQLVRAHYNLREDISHLFTLLEREKLHPVLMKGEAFATLYPKTCVRSCGDIDLYVVPSEFKRTKQLVNEYCGYDAVKASKDGTQHYTLFTRVTEVELHHMSAYPTYNKYIKEVDAWAKQLLTVDSFEKMGPFNVYPLYFNIYFTFDHMCHHIRNEGICLRQMIDWLFLMRQADGRGLYQQPEQVALLRERLSRYQTLNAWQILACIMVAQLGVPRSHFPLYDESKEPIASNILDAVVDHGGFAKVHQTKSFLQKCHDKRTHEEMSYGIRRFIHSVREFYRHKEYTSSGYDELCNILLPDLHQENSYGILGLFRMQYRGFIYRYEKFMELRRLKALHSASERK